MSSQLATFTLAGARYGIDLLRVQEVLRPKARTFVPLAEPSVAGFINLRGQVVLAIDLRIRLGIEPQAADLEPMMVVVQAGGETISLIVDAVGDVIDVTGCRLEVPPDTLPISLAEATLGVYQLEDAPLLVLDIDRVTAPGRLPIRHPTTDKGEPRELLPDI
jgi:purine-binding chemotaxis protein CheW